MRAHSLSSHSPLCEYIDCRGAAIEVEKVGRVTVLTVTGEVDAANVHYLSTGLGRFTSSTRPLVMDLSRIDFFGVQGLRALFYFDDQRQRSGATWILVASRIVHRLLAIVGPGHPITTAGSIAQAVRQLRPTVP
jgi:anti-anti-sigma factor